jgi:N,N'-diacetyllegionaminate synthase
LRSTASWQMKPACRFGATDCQFKAVNGYVAVTQPASSHQDVEIAGRKFGGSRPTLVLAEIAQAHDGSLGVAHAFIDAVAESGADAIKFQTHIAAAESTLDEPFRVRFSMQDENRYAYWRRMEFTREQWAGLARHAQDRGLIFLSSAYSREAVALLKEIGMPAWKIASGEFASTELLTDMLNSGDPILYSTGMSRWAEIDRAVALFRSRGAPFVVLQCTSAYPTPLTEVGLNVMEEMRTRYRCAVGLSDHSGTIFPAFAALAYGAAVVEVHVTFDRRSFGPDTSASLTMDELALLCRARDAFHEMRSHPVDKDAAAAQLAPMRSMFAKSIATVRDLRAGERLDANMLTMKKPATGIPAEKLPELIGRRLGRDVAANRLLRWEDLDG